LEGHPTTAAGLGGFPQLASTPSPAISGISWNFGNVRRLAPGSDLWPATWHGDDAIYVSWGDGGGFGGTNTDGRVALGFGRITGQPPSISAVNVWGGKNGFNASTFGGKASGMLSVGGSLYAWINTQNDLIPDKKLAWSSNGSASWQLATWSWPGAPGAFYPVSFLNYGKAYAGARDRYVYVYGKRYTSNEDDPYTHADHYLARVPKGRIKYRGSYRFFAGFDGSGLPVWSSGESAAVPVLSDVATNVASVVYNAPLGRYLATTGRLGEIDKLTIYDAPQPWGPWTLAAGYDNWGPPPGGYDSQEALLFTIPTKWISSDGRSIWMIYSSPRLPAQPALGLDSFNLIEGTISLR
nr:hypothetical protein [Gemmatimonadota bacterium]